MRLCKKCKVETERNSRGECKVCVRNNDAKWRAANIEKHRIRSRKWGEDNREKVRAWKSANPDLIKAAKHRRRANKLNSGGSFTSLDIKNIYTLQRGKCVCCSISLKKSYHVDHIMPLSKSGSNDKTNIQLLCPNCNLQKHSKHPVDFMQQLGFLI